VNKKVLKKNQTKKFLNKKTQKNPNKKFLRKIKAETVFEKKHLERKFWKNFEEKSKLKGF
jgi:hypothetical protein